MFDGDDMAEALGVPVFYGAVEALVLGIYCIGAWKANWTKAPSHHPFWTVLFESYEVIVAEQEDLSEVEISISNFDECRESVTKTGSRITQYICFPEIFYPNATETGVV